MGGPASRSAGALAAALASVTPLSGMERSALQALDERERALRRGAVLLRQNDPASDIYVLRRGQMMSFRLQDDGRRQILRFACPDAIIGMGALCFRHAPEGWSALTDATVSVIERAAVAAVLVAHPRLALVLAALGGRDAAVLSDRLALLGRSSARARTCALLLELRDRTTTGDSCASTFTIGLTQEELGDAIGLTAVHVNRMLRQLSEERLIARHGARVTVLEPEAMRQISGYTDRTRQLDLNWLSPPAER